eukprot:SAG31_NODE_31695_length_365_cov_0.781955_2_plen_72_part_01
MHCHGVDSGWHSVPQVPSELAAQVGSVYPGLSSDDVDRLAVELEQELRTRVRCRLAVDLGSYGGGTIDLLVL